MFRKLEADTDYEKLADDIIVKTFDTAKRDAGDTYKFKVVGRNSLGDGPESAVATIQVT